MVYFPVVFAKHPSDRCRQFFDEEDIVEIPSLLIFAKAASPGFDFDQKAKKLW
jgi:hypothetical protein